MERPRPGDVPPATATRTISIMIQHDLLILRSRSIVKACSVLAGRSGPCDREDLPLRWPIGTAGAMAADGGLLSLSAKTRIHNSDLNKSTTVCKVGDLEVSPKPFWIWKHIHVHKVHVYEVYAHEVRAHEINAHEVHASEMIVSGLHRHRRYRRFLPTRVWPVRVGRPPC